MEQAHRASSVETLLARLTGEVAPLWISFAVVIDRVLDADRLRSTLQILVERTPRLHLAFREEDARWLTVRRSEACLADALRVSERPAAAESVKAEIITSPIDLRQDLPLRIWQRALTDGAGPVLLAIQLHHAIGDGRALCRLAAEFFRLFHICRDPDAARGQWGGPREGVTDSQLASLVKKTAPGWLRALRPSSLLLAHRGASLPRDSGQVGAPILQARRFRLQAPPRRFGGILMSAIAAETASRARGPRLRFRVPVDLSKQLGIGVVLGNTCIAIPVELDRAKILTLQTDTQALHTYCQRTLTDAVLRGGPQVAILECMATAHVVSGDVLRRNARPGLLAHPRTNTLVTTHVGSIDSAFTDLPATILDAWGHTPTWGVSSIALGSEVFLQCTAFEGLVTHARLSELADALSRRARRIDEELAR
jgi:hypothetical protein